MAICFACGNLESCNATVCWRCNPRHRIFKTANSSSTTQLKPSNSTEPILYDSSTWLYNTHVKPNTHTNGKSEANSESNELSANDQPAQVVKTVSQMMKKLAIDDENLANMAQEIVEKLNHLKVAIENLEKKGSS